MEKKKASPSDREQSNNNGQEDGGPYQRSRELMLQEFGRTYTLVVIELLFTILHPNTDKEKGATRFAILIIALLKIKRPDGTSPKFIWLVSDPAQIQHVLTYMNKHENETFNELAQYAIVAVRDTTSSYYTMLANMANGNAPSHQETLTAFPADGGGFSYSRHFKPETEGDWKNGPLCENIPSVPDEMNDLTQVLLDARSEKLNNVRGTAIEHLENSKISVFNIKEILPILAFCFIHFKSVTLLSII